MQSWDEHVQCRCRLAGAAGAALRLVWAQAFADNFLVSAFTAGCGRGESSLLTGRLSLFQVTQYLLDQSFVMDEETLYEASLRIEPKLPS